jgi:pimeloyl-ACP methyl ester carboxylesterase
MMRSHHRELGAGPRVLCIHPSSSSSSQWKPLMERLSSRFRVIAVDVYGHGRSPRWPDDRDLTLADEAELIAPLIADSGSFSLVGHSYGAAIAVELALAYGDRVSGLVLYEPALWGLLSQELPDDPATHEIESLRDETNCLISEGHLDAATERFMTYWAGEGAWEALTESHRRYLVAGVNSLPPGWAASFVGGPTMEQLGTIRAPCLLLTGGKTKGPAKSITRLMERTLPVVTVVKLPNLGHLGPLTDPPTVNDQIEEFLGSLTH